jgi:hypothetical protein
MDLLPFPLSSPNPLQEQSIVEKTPVHDIRELFELAFPLLSESSAAIERDSEFLDNILPFKP